MIIDGHVHIHPNSEGFGREKDASLEKLIESMESCIVEKAVVLPIWPEVSNEFVHESVKRYPDRLVGFASVNPLGGDDAACELERSVKEFGLKGLKLHPRSQGFRADDERILPVIRKCAELEIPVVLDSILNRPGYLMDQRPLLVDKLARDVPDAKIIMAHMGGFRFMDALAVANTNKNVYLDISVTLSYFSGSSFEKDLEFVIKKVGADRIIYGSDHPDPMLDAAFEESSKIFERFDLTETEKKRILGETMKRLLNP